MHIRVTTPKMKNVLDTAYTAPFITAPAYSRSNITTGGGNPSDEFSSSRLRLIHSGLRKVLLAIRPGLSAPERPLFVLFNTSSGLRTKDSLNFLSSSTPSQSGWKMDSGKCPLRKMPPSEGIPDSGKWKAGRLNLTKLNET